MIHPWQFKRTPEPLEGVNLQAMDPPRLLLQLRRHSLHRLLPRRLPLWGQWIPTLPPPRQAIHLWQLRRP
jgi:hypothetical protein